MASRNAPTPGSTIFSAICQHGRIAGDRRRVPDALERLLHAAKVAHAVVDDGDHGWRIQEAGYGGQGRSGATLYTTNAT